MFGYTGSVPPLVQCIGSRLSTVRSLYASTLDRMLLADRTCQSDSGFVLLILGYSTLDSRTLARYAHSGGA